MMGDPPPISKKKLLSIRRNKSMDYKGIMPDSINLKKLIETGNLDGLKYILEKEKTAIHASDAEAQTLLHYACEFGQPEIAKYLLNKGLDVNAKNKFGWTPMILAVCHGHLEVAMELCRQDNIDMSPKIPNSSRNVLHFLGRHWSPEIVPVILQKCSLDVINAKDHHGDSPLHRVCIHCNTDCVKALIACGADVNLQNTQGETPIHYASRAGVEEIINHLLANGADPEIRGKHGTYTEVANSATANNTAATTPDELENTPLTAAIRTLTHSSSAPVSSYAALVSPPSSANPPIPVFLVTTPLADGNSTSDVSRISNTTVETTVAVEKVEGAGVTVVSASVVATETHEDAHAQPSSPLSSPAPVPALPHSRSQSAVSQAIGAVGTAVGAAFGAGAQGNFSVKGTVKKLVEGILASDMEIPGFDTKKLFQKMVYLTNFRDVLIKEIVPQLKQKLMTTTLPAISGTTDSPIGEIQYEVWKVSLSSLSLDDKSISCEPKLEGLKIAMKMSAILKNIHFKYSTHVMKDEGTATAEVQNISCEFILGADIENKKPKLTIKDTNVEMENLNLEIHKAKVKWLYNTIFGIISNKVKNLIAQLLTTTLAQQLSVLEGLFNDKLALLWTKMRKKKKKKARENGGGDQALIAAQTASNLVMNEEILRIKAEIARTKLEMLKLNLPPVKGNEMKCYYYQTRSPTSPIIIMVDTHPLATLSDLQKFITSEYQSLDPHLFPSRTAASLAQTKNSLKSILRNTAINYVSASVASNAATPLITAPSSEPLLIGANTTPSPEITTTSTSPSSSPTLPISSALSPPTLPTFIPVPTKIEINTTPNINANSNVNKGSKKMVDWKFKDKDGDFVHITKRNTIEQIRLHAQSLHIFEKRLDE